VVSLQPRRRANRQAHVGHSHRKRLRPGGNQDQRVPPDAQIADGDLRADRDSDIDGIAELGQQIGGQHGWRRRRLPCWASPPVRWVGRTTVAPYEAAGTVIPARSRVVLFYAGANHDPQRFEQPDFFDVDRKALGHTGFGHGTHFCMGAHLGRLEVTVALNALFDRISRLELAGPVAWTRTPPLSGPTALPLRGVTA
jgi:Cytochrome P450